jgi:hypothetical protein
MATQLSLPVDIPWRRLAFSTDMIDHDFTLADLPPKWRSSLVAFYHLVPVEDTALEYPDGRLVYIRLACSITGFNPNEDLRRAAVIASEGDAPGDTQESTWEAIMAQDWASTYWPCLGAIVQVAIYPHGAENVPTDSFPYIMDFEPKKRELYETRTDSGEILSGSSEKLNVSKSQGTTDASEKSHIVSGEVGGSFLGIGAKAGYQYNTKKSSETETVDTRTIDSARERRETVSHSTVISQMYQLFTSYHLGTNRAVFSIAPRPHIVNDAKQAPFNLIRGRRLLEGMQDIFLVVYVPSSLPGIALQVNLDTGHEVSWLDNTAMMMKPADVPEVDPPPPGPHPHPWPDVAVIPEGVLEPMLSSLVVTRRVIRTTALFDAEHGLIATQIGDPASSARVVFEALVHRPKITPGLQALAAGQRPGPDALVTDADQLNAAQARVQAAMLRGISAGAYAPRPLVETRAFRRLAVLTLADRTVADSGLPASLVKKLQAAGVKTVGDLYASRQRLVGLDTPQLADARRQVIRHLVGVGKKS